MPDNPEIAGGLLRQDARAVDAVGERARVDQQRDQIVEFLFEAVEVLRAGASSSCGDRSRLTPPSAIGASHQPRAEQPILQPDETLRAAPVRGWRHGERDVGGQRADVGRVVVDALELEQHDAAARARAAAPRRRRDARSRARRPARDRPPCRRRSIRRGTARDARAAARSASRFPCGRRTAEAGGTGSVRRRRRSESVRAR